MEGIVFDFDGVIGQTMEQHAAAYRKVLEPHGIHVTNESVFALEGARSETIIAQLGRPDDAAVLADAKQKAFGEMGKPGLYPLAAEIVKAAQARTKTAIVTGTRRDNLEQLMADLLPGFDAVLCQEDYQKDKPDPEPYARAADALGAAPSALVCIENAVRGIQSARAAGYGHVVGIATTMPAPELAGAGAHAVALDHDALFAHLRARWGAA